MIATKSNNINLLQLLFKYHADSNQADNEGNTCLIYSINNDLKDVALFLISKDEIDVNKGNELDKTSPLMACIKKNSIDICSALSHRAEIDISLKDIKGISFFSFYLSISILDCSNVKFIRYYTVFMPNISD